MSPHAADIQDPDGGVVVMTTLFGLYPFLLKLYADRGFQGPKVQKGLRKAVALVRALAFLKLASIRLMVRRLCI